MAVKVYTKPDCPNCENTYALLNELQIDFTTVDIYENPNTLAYLKSKGFRGAPVVETDEKSWSGFNEKAIRALVPAENLYSEDVWDF